MPRSSASLSVSCASAWNTSALREFALRLVVRLDDAQMLAQQFGVRRLDEGWLERQGRRRMVPLLLTGVRRPGQDHKGKSLAYVYCEESPAADRRRTCSPETRHGESPSTSTSCRSCCARLTDADSRLSAHCERHEDAVVCIFKGRATLPSRFFVRPAPLYRRRRPLPPHVTKHF